MAKYKIISLLCWTGVIAVVGSVYLEYIPEFVAAPPISILIALGYLTAGLSVMAKSKEEEREEREEPFVGY